MRSLPNPSVVMPPKLFRRQRRAAQANSPPAAGGQNAPPDAEAPVRWLGHIPQPCTATDSASLPGPESSKGHQDAIQRQTPFPASFSSDASLSCSAARQAGTATFRRPHRAVSQIMSFIQSKEYPVPVPQAGDPIKINGRWLLTMRDGATRIQWLADHGATSFPLGVSATGRSIIAATAGVKSI